MLYMYCSAAARVSKKACLEMLLAAMDVIELVDYVRARPHSKPNIVHSEYSIRSDWGLTRAHPGLL